MIIIIIIIFYIFFLFGLAGKKGRDAVRRPRVNLQHNLLIWFLCQLQATVAPPTANAPPPPGAAAAAANPQALATLVAIYEKFISSVYGATTLLGPWP